ncbi:cell division topological specificity factor MinE [Alteromonas sp. 76-1]|jgi:cell division topological specificity factor|uniref:Cell division topological specificity factor n=1 Tax=Alteromonas naphthalenivorans TaxID=715451 RepID=F5Z9M2_ALTNA|nr:MULTISPECIES: cell division topological specificity factor MinE [Alteromonas]PHS55082.1 MAG: cell division topological specificity factor MinE [Alteromonas sp.]AEF01867.1 cell division topological specificity factor MinE [Alteromonas naphthalenivorans]MCQ8848412.1 cell division topological specificity factor MinE [Alteromonas stellipolaris]MDP2535843.1 cell division topological specificity factor MinE [Alteromonas stellipolaris]VEL98272.1 cell division topological specificity factor MinE [A|tara:strand:+ start:1524 stop:1781 length:258 start_codon:yes stop_codon:yes gene_type:complete
MSIFDYLLKKKEKPRTAAVAKERLQIIVAHERRKRTEPDYLPMMQQEIIQVIRKYVSIADDQVSVQLESSDDCSVLELNVTLPES